VIPAEIIAYDLWILLGVSALLLVMGRTGWRIGRREGAVLLMLYAAYVWSILPTSAPA